ncbi:MAG: DNA repair protein RecO [Kordiimonadaceae bacterium]|nr:DNA repair protein RecO [Kordiimonadaceae bacterium]MBO6569916.1 DNA repair protein RecO [Kordiimonadaceae bacterium]MBO6965987.1 DNA repair protein RecO [Kordiimonadaceae bacterium]
MEWQDDAIVLSAARFGEHDALLEVMTPQHGRSRGFVKAGMSRRNKAVLQPGNKLSVSWRSRLETNLGRFQVELVHSPLGLLISDPARMAALAAVCAVVQSTMPERQLHEGVFDALDGFIKLLEAEDGQLSVWGAALARIELGILAELGYGLDLSECAATGARDNLIYVSPKSGRAVSAEAGSPYKGRLLDLPAFLMGDGELGKTPAIAGLQLTGFFLERNVWVVAGNGQPDARERLIARLVKHK